MQDQQNQAPRKPRSKWIRLLALIAAIAVIVGSIFVVQVFGKGKESSADSSALLVPTARAEDGRASFKTLKKGGSGAPVRKAQEALAALGYYDGRIDGNFSKAFEEAVIAFQRDFGLTANGQIDWDLYQLITEELPAETAAPASKPTARPQQSAAPPAATPEPEEAFVYFGEEYTDRDHVAAYLHLFGELPPNYITKEDAEALGWVNSRGNLWDVAPGKSIGGDYFGNYERQLPTAKGRKYYECDIDYDLDRDEYRGRRNGKRIVYSNDGLIFYTGDHYETYEEITFEGDR